MKILKFLGIQPNHKELSQCYENVSWGFISTIFLFKPFQISNKDKNADELDDEEIENFDEKKIFNIGYLQTA